MTTIRGASCPCGGMWRESKFAWGGWECLVPHQTNCPTLAPTVEESLAALDAAIRRSQAWLRELEAMR